jgi:hypothetical protein
VSPKGEEKGLSSGSSSSSLEDGAAAGERECRLAMPPRTTAVTAARRVLDLRRPRLPLPRKRSADAVRAFAGQQPP